MNREYLKYAIVLWAIAIPCLFAGIMVKHWGFEAIAGVLLILSYLLLYWIPESESNGKKPLQKETKKEDEEK